jgi:GT2 family glycosyltransferase
MSAPRSPQIESLSVTAIIVSYRSAALSIEALRSLERERQLGGAAIRAVVIDNASGDLPLLQQAVASNGWSSWAKTVAAPRNGGFGYGNNLGFELACAQGTPSYLYLLNPDAQVRAGAVGALIDFLQSHPEAGIAGSSFEHADGTEWSIAFRFPGLISEFCDGVQLGPLTRLLERWCVPIRMGKTPRQVDWICGASMMIRPEVLTAIGGFDERYFLYFEETDFCLRARRAGYSTWYVPDSRVMHIRGQSTGVTALKARPPRLPAYWFESRRTYFATALGHSRGLLVDSAALVSHGFGRLIDSPLRSRREKRTPYYIRDLWRHSRWRSANRQSETPRTSPERFRQLIGTAGSQTKADLKFAKSDTPGEMSYLSAPQRRP